MTVGEILEMLESLGSAENVAGMARYGIVTEKAFGVSAPVLKQLAKEIKKTAIDRHEMACRLWDTGVHEARAIAFLIEDPKSATEEQMEEWVKDFDNWAICDSCCGTLFDKTQFAYKKAFEWSGRNEEFIKRAGIVLIAWLAVHDKKADDNSIAAFLPTLENNADDDRNFVKKAVNWALRQIGKRSLYLNELAVGSAERIKQQGTRPARWIAADALRELTSEKTRSRLAAKRSKLKRHDS